jgi:hypothetical protein
MRNSSNSAENLLRESIKRKPIATSENGKIKLFNFADPAFSKYLIRSVGRRNRLECATYLTPVDYIFHGPNIGQPLLESMNVHGRHNHSSNLSIILKQEGECLDALIEKHGKKSVVDRLAKHPEAIELLIRTVAFVGAFEKTFDLSERDIPPEERRIDIHWNNLMLDESGNLSLIDQMTYYDIFDRPNEKLDFTKARNSVIYLRNSFIKLIGDSSPELLKVVEDSSAQVLIDLRHARYRLKNPREQLQHLQNHLTPLGTEKWRGIEPVISESLDNEPPTKLAFGRVASVKTSCLDVKALKKQELLDALNELHKATVASVNR